MSKSIQVVAFSFFSLSLLLSALLLYLSSLNINESIKQKQSFVVFVGLTDLAISNEPYLRHRSVSGIFDVYSMDGALRENQTETFIITKEAK